MRFLLVLTVFTTVFTIINGYTAQEAWDDYKLKHGKSYWIPFDGGQQERLRKALFHVRYDGIIKHNTEKTGTYRQEPNKFSDMTPKEREQHLGVKADLLPSARFLETIGVDMESRQIPPDSLDYRYDKCLPAVKDQGSCGSCWAFAAIAPLEFSKCKKSGSAVVLSEQQLVDCDKRDSGCNGGWYDTAWDYIKSANGVAPKSSYAYVARAGRCRFNWLSMVGAKVLSRGNVQSNNATAMQVALQKYGPLAVAFNVINSFFSYASGVYTDNECDVPKTVNHAVVIVGWGKLNGVNYWIVRNSWGTSWGLSGYFLIERGTNKCNIEVYPSYVVAA